MAAEYELLTLYELVSYPARFKIGGKRSGRLSRVHADRVTKTHPRTRARSARLYNYVVEHKDQRVTTLHGKLLWKNTCAWFVEQPLAITATGAV